MKINRILAAFAATSLTLSAVMAATPLAIAQQAYLKASNPGAGDEFARAVAISGDTVVVGADYEDSSGTDCGAAYVFVRNGTNWVQQAYLKASNASGGDRFGFAVAISGDTIVVGSLFESGSGAAYVFARHGTNWVQQARLKASNAETGDLFGDEVAVSGDTIVVSAFTEDSNATGVNGNQSNNDATDSGAAYVFVRNGTNWTQQAYLKASNTGAGDAFYKIAVSGDTIVVGAIREDSDATGINGDQDNNRATDSGAAYVFVRHGTNWAQQAYLKGSNTEAGDRFGFAAISGDTILAGAFREDSIATGVNGNQNDNGATDSGAAYAFVRNGTNWIQQAYLKASNSEADDRFGWAVSLSGDTAIIGAHQEDSDATGTNGAENNNNAQNSGAAYVFVRTGTNWTQQAYLKSSNAEANDNFGGGPNLAPGTTVAVSGDTVVVGASYEDSNANGIANSGAAYIFTGLGRGAPLLELRLELTTRIDQNTVRFQLSGESGQTVRVQRSTDLINWTDWQSAIFGAAPSIVSDTNAATAPVRFYRVVSP